MSLSSPTSGAGTWHVGDGFKKVAQTRGLSRRVLVVPCRSPACAAPHYTSLEGYEPIVAPRGAAGEMRVTRQLTGR